MDQEDVKNSNIYSLQEFKDAVQDPFSTDVGAVAMNFTPKNCKERFYKAIVLEGEYLLDEAEKEYRSVLDEVKGCDEDIEFMASYRLNKLSGIKD